MTPSCRAAPKLASYCFCVRSASAAASSLDCSSDSISALSVSAYWLGFALGFGLGFGFGFGLGFGLGLGLG